MLNNFWNNYHYQIVGFFAGFIIVLLLSNLVVDRKLDNMRVLLEDEIAEIKTLIADNQSYQMRRLPHPSTEEFIPNCSLENQTQLDNLLIALDTGLTASELNELMMLLQSCGLTKSHQDKHLLSLIDWQLSKLESVATLLSHIKNAEEINTYIADTKARQSSEKQKVDLHYDLVVTQRDIVLELQAGQGEESDEIKNLLRKANEIKSELAKTRQ